jgi:hypothetical protein
MTVRVKTFELKDLDTFVCRDPSWPKVDQENLLNYPMVTLYFDEIPIGLFGLLFKHKGVAEAFMYGSIHINKYKNDFQDMTHELLNLCFNEHQIHRLEMYVDKTNKSWAESLGFELEGKVKNYTEEKQDAYLYARFE